MIGRIRSGGGSAGKRREVEKMDENVREWNGGSEDGLQLHFVGSFSGSFYSKANTFWYLIIRECVCIYRQCRKLSQIPVLNSCSAA